MNDHDTKHEDLANDLEDERVDGVTLMLTIVAALSLLVIGFMTGVAVAMFFK